MSWCGCVCEYCCCWGVWVYFCVIDGFDFVDEL